jgi:uncharacterized protein YlaI
MNGNLKCHVCDGSTVFIKENRFQVMIWGKYVNICTNTYLCKKCEVRISPNLCISTLKKMRQGENGMD